MYTEFARRFSVRMMRNGRPAFTYFQALAIALLISSTAVEPATAQNFVRETNTGNPIFGDATNGHYSGCAWMDYDGDGDLDLFVCNRTANDLYRNDAGVFTRITTGALLTDASVDARGTTWGDYDNDGDLDCFISGVPSALYNNDGAGNFTKVTTGDIFTEDNRGWSSGWADYDNDGNLDLVISHPAGFVGGGGATPNHLYHNDGPPGYTFTKLDTGIIVTGLAPYTHGSWEDYDDDGDVDLFMASGPANGTPAPDFIYINQLTETGAAGFVRLTDPPLGTDPVDGQTWGFSDYDLDGDIDLYLTNWANPSFVDRPNHLYRNDGGGVYTPITTGSIATDADVSLANVWGDFDNDGDEDCFVANDIIFPSRYYLNNGDGSFTRVDTGFIGSLTGPNSGATVGDYDDDGDLDLFVAGNGAANRGLFYNELVSSNHWVKFKLEGIYSNKSAIGAVVRVKATINGSPVWLRRSVGASQAFMSMNSLELHFGLGDASVVDSVQIRWPSGTIQTLESVTTDQTVSVAEEGVGFFADNRFGPVGMSTQFTPLTAETVSSWSWDFGDGANSSLMAPSHQYDQPGLHTVQVDIQSASGPFQSVQTGFIAIHADTLEAVGGEGSAGSQFAVQVRLRNFLPVGFVTIPFSWSGPMEITFAGESTAGLRSDFMTGTTVVFDPFGKNGVITLAAPGGTSLPEGDGSVLTLNFDIPAGGAADSAEVQVDAHSGFNPSAQSSFGNYDFTPLSGSIIRNCCVTAGDADGSGSVNIADVTYLIDRIFAGGPPPPCQDEGDADGSNSINIADVTYIIARIFSGGPAPICGTTGM